MGLGMGSQSATIAMYRHGLVCLPDVGDEVGVAEEVYRRLIVQKDHVTEIESAGGSRAEPKVKKLVLGFAFGCRVVACGSLSKGCLLLEY